MTAPQLPESAVQSGKRGCFADRSRHEDRRVRRKDRIGAPGHLVHLKREASFR
jgi:hypothetical protein